LLLDQVYLHPTGQIPAYEWNFSDVNPPVQAFATIFLYRTEQALRLEQADGTAWVALFCENMLEIACDLAAYDSTYEDLAANYALQLVLIARSLNAVGTDGMWDEEDGFYYDVLRLPNYEYLHGDTAHRCQPPNRVDRRRRGSDRIVWQHRCPNRIEGRIGDGARKREINGRTSPLPFGPSFG
jgi:hypothetical protein